MKFYLLFKIARERKPCITVYKIHAFKIRENEEYSSIAKLRKLNRSKNYCIE
jgi:hypothetical protein